MSENDLHKVYLAYIEAINARQFDRLHEFAHEQLVFNDVPHSRDDYTAILQGQMDAVPDFVWHVEDLVIEDNHVAARLTDTGTPVKTFLGLEPTGASVKFTQYAFYHLRDGRFENVWYLLDAQTVEAQLRAGKD